LTEPPPGGAGGRRFHFSLPLLEHIREQRRFFQATMVRGNDARIRRRLVRQVAELARIELDRIRPEGDRRLRDAEAHGAAGAFAGIVTWWLSGPSRLTVEQVDEVFQGLVPGAAS